MQRIGIIGGSGLDNPDILEQAHDLSVNTVWGAPSAALRLGKIGGVDVALLGRHGRQHTIPPTQVNYRANVQALKDAGCTHAIIGQSERRKIFLEPDVVIKKKLKAALKAGLVPVLCIGETLEERASQKT